MDEGSLSIIRNIKLVILDDYLTDFILSSPISLGNMKKLNTICLSVIINNDICTETETEIGINLGVSMYLF